MAKLNVITRIGNLYNSKKYILPASGDIYNFFESGAFQTFLSSSGNKRDLMTLETALSDLDVANSSSAHIKVLSEIQTAIEAELSMMNLGGVSNYSWSVSDAIGLGLLNYKLDRDVSLGLNTDEFIKEKILAATGSEKSYSSSTILSQAIFNAIGGLNYNENTITRFAESISANIGSSSADYKYSSIDLVKTSIYNNINNSTGSTGTGSGSLIQAMGDFLAEECVGATQSELESAVSFGNKLWLIAAVNNGGGYSVKSLADAMLGAMTGGGSLTSAELQQDFRRMIALGEYEDANAIASALNSSLFGVLIESSENLASAISDITLNSSESGSLVDSNVFTDGMSNSIGLKPVSLFSAIGSFDISDAGSSITEAIKEISENRVPTLSSLGITTANSFEYCIQGTGTALVHDSSYSITGSVSNMTEMMKAMLACADLAEIAAGTGTTKAVGKFDGTSCNLVSSDAIYGVCVAGLSSPAQVTPI